MDELTTLALEGDLSAPVTPGQALKREHIKDQQNKRQQKCRASKRLTSQQKALKKLEMSRLAVEAARVQLTLNEAVPAPSRDIFKALGHEWFFLSAMFLGGHIARRIFESVTPEDFTQPSHRIIFEAAQKIHERGHQVTTGAIEAQLKRDGILLFFPISNLEAGVPKLPQHIALDDIDNRAMLLKQA